MPSLSLKISQMTKNAIIASHITVEIEFVDTLIKPDKDRLSLTSNKRKTERERRVGVDDRQR